MGRDSVVSWLQPVSQSWPIVLALVVVIYQVGRVVDTVEHAVQDVEDNRVRIERLEDLNLRLDNTIWSGNLMAPSQERIPLLPSRKLYITYIIGPSKYCSVKVL